MTTPLKNSKRNSLPLPLTDSSVLKPQTVKRKNSTSSTTSSEGKEVDDSQEEFCYSHDISGEEATKRTKMNTNTANK